jgi:hypothetical protein
VENKQAVELARAGLALLDGTVGGLRKNRKKKALAKAKEATKEAEVKTPRKPKEQPRCPKTP